MKIWTSQLRPAAYAASSAAADYPASHVGLRSISRPWLAASAGAGEHITIDLGMSWPLGALMLTGINFDGATILADDNPEPTTQVIATLPSAAEPHGRRKALAQLAGVSARYVRIAFGAAQSADGFPWRIGAAYLYGPTLIDAPFLLGSTRKLNRPRVQQALPNGITTDARTGEPWTSIELQMRTVRGAGPDASDIEDAATNSVIAVDLELPTRPDLAWPMQSTAPDFTATFLRTRQDSATLTLREVV